MHNMQLVAHCLQFMPASRSRRRRWVVRWFITSASIAIPSAAAGEYVQAQERQHFSLSHVHVNFERCLAEDPWYLGVL